MAWIQRRCARRDFVAARAALLLASLLTQLIAGCVGNARAASAPASAPTNAPDCVVDGVRMADIAPLAPVCRPGAPSEMLAGGLRSYQQEHYSEAARLFGTELDGTPATERTTWWQQARFFLAKTYIHLHREREAHELFRQIVRTPDDSYRWAAAGWLCGEKRQSTDVFLPYDYPACRDTSRDAAYVPSTGPLPSSRPARPAAPRPLSRVSVGEAMQATYPDILMCGDGRGGHIVINYVFASSGDTTSVSLREGAFYDGTPVAGTPVEACALAIARRAWLPPFTNESFSTPYGYSLR